MDQININQQVFLNQFQITDNRVIADYLNDRDIYEMTLRLPFPYTETDADKYIEAALNFEKENGIRRNWAIRHVEAGLIGSIGLLFLDGLDAHKNEFGYWLAKPFWGKGIMSEVIGIFTNFCLNQYKYKRFQATVDPRNHASARVLEKNGFHYEGTLKNYNVKNGHLMDVMVYAVYQN